MTPLKLKAPIKIRLSDGTVIRESVTKLSDRGFYVESEASADKGSQFDVKIQLIVGRHMVDVVARTQIEGVIITSGNRFGLTFRFLNFYGNSEDYLVQYLTQFEKKKPKKS